MSPETLLVEKRSASLVDAEIRDHEFRGYAAVFDTPWHQDSIDLAGYVESVARGAFRKALGQSGNIPLLWQHDRNQMLATSEGGTLRVKEDGKGLLVEATLPKSGLGEYVREMIERGDVRGMSYGMETAPADSIITEKQGVMYRSIANVRRLLDTTLTWEPAYAATSVELRSLGFAALPLQELVSGSEDQTDDAATVTSSVAPTFRLSEFEINAMAEGVWPV